MKLTISEKIYGVTTIFLFLYFVIVITSFLSLERMYDMMQSSAKVTHQINEEVAELIEQQLLVQIAIGREFQTLRVGSKEDVIEAEKYYLDELEILRKEILETEQHISKTEESGKYYSKFASLSKLMNALFEEEKLLDARVSQAEQIFKNIKANKNDLANKAFLRSILNTHKNHQARRKAYNNLANQFDDEINVSVKATKQKMMVYQWSLYALSFFLVILLSIFVSRSIIRPVRRMGELLDKIIKNNESGVS